MQGITQDSTTEVLPCKLYNAECCAAGTSPAHSGCIGYVLLTALVWARLAAFTVKQKGFAAVAPLVPHLMRRIVEQAAAECAGAELDEMAGAPMPWVRSTWYSSQQQRCEAIAGARPRAPRRNLTYCCTAAPIDELSCEPAFVDKGVAATL